MEICDKLLQFPLFQGMSHGDLMEVVGHTRFDFTKLGAKAHIVNEGEPCTHLYFLTSGAVEAVTCSDDKGYRVCETLRAPYALQPERIFGVTQRFSTTFKTLTDCNLFTIDKQEVMLLMETQLVFRLNMTNLLAAEAQRFAQRQWRPAPKSITERLTRFFLSHCLYPAGPKTFYVLMNRLAQELNDSRLAISQTLNRMQADGLITLHRGRIEIPMIERLLM